MISQKCSRHSVDQTLLDKRAVAPYAVNPFFCGEKEVSM
jgi:hypothetical protein